MESKSIVRLVISLISVLIIFSLILTLNPFSLVTAGHRGVLLNWGAVSGIMNEGINFRVPLMQKIIEVDVRTQKNEAFSIAYSKDLQTVNATIALNYHLDPNKVDLVYQKVGLGFSSKIIAPAIQEAVKAVSAKFTAQELIEKRQDVRNEIRALIEERLLSWNILVDEFSIVNFDFSDAYEKAIEEKQVAQQSALKARNDLDRIKLEAEQQIARAKAEAETIRIQAEAITQQGGKDYVQLKAIEKWNGNLPTQMVPGGAVPFLNLNQ